jgi:hypothetical protein
MLEREDEKGACENEWLFALSADRFNVSWQRDFASHKASQTSRKLVSKPRKKGRLALRAKHALELLLHPNCGHRMEEVGCAVQRHTNAGD